MCELLGMNCNVPTDITFSFAGFRQRGGRTGPHQDGWGIAFYEGKGARLFHDVVPSVSSEIARLVEQYPDQEHQRDLAHPPPHALAGLHREHPSRFSASSGAARGSSRTTATCTASSGSRLTFYRPDRHDRLGARVLLHPRRDSPSLSRAASGAATPSHLIGRLADEIAALGRFNFLMCDATHLYAYCTNKLCWIQRRAPFTRAALVDADLEVDFSQHTTPNDKVVVIATQPLTRDETWTPVSPGRALRLRQRRAARAREVRMSETATLAGRVCVLAGGSGGIGAVARARSCTPKARRS